MNIETPNLTKTNETQSTNKTSQQTQNSDVKFADELKELEKNTKTEEVEDVEEAKKTKETNLENKNSETKNTEPNNNPNLNKNNNIKKQVEVYPEQNPINNAVKDLTTVVEKLNQSEDKTSLQIKKPTELTDNESMINNDFNIQENKDALPQMTPNMNFSGNGQPFSSFMENESKKTESANSILGASAKDLAEEAAILSTMAENIALANRNNIIESTKTITDNEGIKKLDVKSGTVVENIVKFDSVIMNQADVEVFADIVNKGEVDLNNLAPEAAKKSVQVSKTLADLLAKAMDTKQPVRIDFDNNISIIIKISRDGKISADFLPSSQVAEAYLKENLPLLKQRFDENNIKYEELNQRERRGNNKEQQKKGRDNE